MFSRKFTMRLSNFKTSEPVNNYNIRLYSGKQNKNYLRNINLTKKQRPCYVYVVNFDGVVRTRGRNKQLLSLLIRANHGPELYHLNQITSNANKSTNFSNNIIILRFNLTKLYLHLYVYQSSVKLYPLNIIKTR